MKSKFKKRIVASMLCMVMVLSGSISAFAEENAESADNTNKTESVQEIPDVPTEEPEVTPEEPEEPVTPPEEEKTPEQKEPEEETPKAYAATYENADVIIKVSAKEGIVPKGAELSVIPIEKKEITSSMTAKEKTEAEKINKQHEQTEKKLKEESKKKETTLEGFLAYDISFLVDGQEVEPNGDVDVEMNFKKAAIPEEIDAEIAKETEVSIMHLEENKDGTVKEVVDMGKQNKVKAMKTTEEKKVEKAEFKTESFSTFTITWSRNGKKAAEVTVHYVTAEGTEIPDINQSDVTGGTNNGEIVYLTNYIQVINGYTFSKITKDSHTGTEISKLRYRRDDNVGRRIQYDVGNDWKDWLKFNTDNPPKGDIYIVYNRDENQGGGDVEETPQLGVPEHNKYIKKNGDDDYRLSLDVTGKLGAATPIDVLLIVDKSGSMEDGGRYNNVNDAIYTLVTELRKSDANINLAAVTFSSAYPDGKWTDQDDNRYKSNDNLEDAWNPVGWTPVNSFSFRLSQSDCDGGTNWQAGVKKGNEVLEARKAMHPNNQRYVIFLTDGDPTYRYKTGSSTITQGAGGSDRNRNNYNYAVTEWTNSTALTSTISRYVVDATPNGSDNCTGLAKDIKGTCLPGNDKTQLQNSFKQIAEAISKPAYNNVSIIDTLSEHVDFAKEKNLVVEKITKNADGSENVVIIDPSKYTVTYPDSKTIQVLLEKQNDGTGGKLEDDVTYRIKFDVVTTTEAYYDYQNNGGVNDANNDGTIDGYGGIKGDDGTDAVDNIPPTSSLKDGFHSNDRAYVSYKVNDGEQEEADYKHPVIQVKEEKVDRTVEKQWVGITEEEKKSLSVEVELVATVTINGEEQIITRDECKSLPLYMTKILNEDEGWTFTWNNLPTYYYYKDQENILQKTPITYSVKEINVPDGFGVTVDTEGNITTVTNTKKQDWQIVKVSSTNNTLTLAGAEFTLTAENQKDENGKPLVYTGTSGDDGVIVWKLNNAGVASKDILPDTYILEEILAPVGYEKNTEKWTVKIQYAGALPEITGKTFVDVNGDGTLYQVEYENTPAYDLPESGGSGIYWYMIGGILLMLAAALILYKDRCKEVLRR